MKNLITALLLAFCFASFAQTPSALQKPTDSEQSVKKPITVDFDFSFYPPPTYGKLWHHFDTDSTSGATTAKNDSVKFDMPVIFEKKGDLFTIRPLSNLSDPAYSSSLTLVGSLTDGAFLYRKDEQEKELVIVNPMRGYAVIIFRECKKGEDQCEYINHYFGNVPFGAYQ